MADGLKELPVRTFDSIKSGAEKLGKNQYVWYAVAGVVALVLIVYLRNNSADNAPVDASGTAAQAQLPFVPVSAGGITDTSGNGSSGFDPNALLALESASQANNLQLGLAQVSEAENQAQLNASIEQMGLQVTAQGQQYSLLQNLASQFTQSVIAHPTHDLNVENGTINLGSGSDLSFQLADYSGSAPRALVYGANQNTLNQTLFPVGGNYGSTTVNTTNPGTSPGTVANGASASSGPSVAVSSPAASSAGASQSAFVGLGLR